MDELRALAHPLRQRILGGFSGAPLTTKRLAEKIGESPGKLYHHVEALESAGLIRLVATRPKRGTVEKLYQAVARAFEVDARAFTPGTDARELGELQGVIVASLEETLRAARTDYVREREERPDCVAGVHVHTRVRATGDDLRRLAGFVQAWIESVEGESVARDRHGAEPTPFLLDVTAVALPDRNDDRPGGDRAAGSPAGGDLDDE